jgi:transglutaminase-like putative cysteine protease
MNHLSLKQNTNHLFLVAVIVGIMLSAFFLTSTMSGLPSLDSFASSASPTHSPSISPINSSSPGLSPSPGPDGNGVSGGNGSSPSPSGEVNGTKPGNSDNSSASCNGGKPELLVEGGPNGYETVLEIFGKTQTSYIRTGVGEIYQTHVWAIDPAAEVTSYDGSFISQELPQYSSKSQGSVTIKLVGTWNGFTPSLLYSNKISLGQTLPTQFYPSQNIFKVLSQFNGAYDDEYTHYVFNEEMLRTTPVVSDTSAIYLGVPDSLKSSLQEILGRIDLAHASSDYDKITLIRNYLEANYVYDLNYTRAPANQDPVHWFLFNQKRGVCANFNSAFVLLLRAEGIPSRFVGGFAIDSSADYQKVIGMQAHAWAEVKFSGIGWVEFDATGPGSIPPAPDSSVPVKNTITKISSLSPSATRGGVFSIQGSVTDFGGTPASGLTVTISLKAQKSDLAGLVCDATQTSVDGRFSLSCQVPKDVNVGNYQVVATTQGNSIYNGSESDPVLQVNAKTQISISPTDSAIVGRPFSITAQLTESDTGKPLSNSQLALSYFVDGQEKRAVGITNKDGFAVLSFGNMIKTSDNKLNFTVTFNQAGFFLASETKGQLNLVEPSQAVAPSSKPSSSPSPVIEQSSFFSSPLFFAAIIVASFSISLVAFLLYRKRKSRISQTKSVNPLPVLDPINIEAKNADNLMLRIVFPLVRPPFPDVWGVGEKFKVEFHLSRNDCPVQGALEVQFGNQPTEKLSTDENGVAQFDIQGSAKGTYLLTAKYVQSVVSDLIASRNLRIVDYTEEVVSIFKETFEFEKTKGAPISQKTTPREFENALLKTFSFESNTPLENLVSIFEVADYSLYNLGRTEYEKMYLASISVKEAPMGTLRCD